jgi:photosystem II stability/assembly factor-like uncharacterized protein
VTWSASLLSGAAPSTTLYAAAFARDRSLAWLAGDGVIARSVDEGATFAAVAGVPAGSWRAIRFAADAQHGVAVAADGQVLLSSDGGASWHAAATAPAALAGVSIAADGSRIVAVGAAGLVWRSNDAGASFTRVDAGATADLAAVGFYDAGLEQGWAVGGAGTVVHTLDGAASFAALSTGLTADLTAVEDFAGY